MYLVLWIQVGKSLENYIQVVTFLGFVDFPAKTTCVRDDF